MLNGSTAAYLSETEGRAVPTRPGEPGLASPVVRSMKSTLLGKTGETIRSADEDEIRSANYHGGQRTINNRSGREC